MLVEGKDIIGLDVISADTGRKLHVIEDIIYDTKQQRILAFAVKEAGYFSESQLALIKHIKSIGKDAFLIDSASSIKKASVALRSFHKTTQGNNLLTSTVIVSEDGIELGRVNDVYFQPNTGAAAALEVVHFNQDTRILYKKIIPTAAIITAGEEITIVQSFAKNIPPQETMQVPLHSAMHAQHYVTSSNPEKANAELQKIFTIQGSSSQANVENITHRLMEGVVQTSKQAKKEMNSLRRHATKLRKRQAVGKYTTKTILTPNDQYFLPRGAIVTYEALNKAERGGFLQQVIDNTTNKPS